MEYSSINQGQVVSETDTFTRKRYEQFSKFINQRDSDMSILDIGCNTGRGGEVLRRCFPQARIIGIDVVEDRLNAIPDGVYDSLLCESITRLSLESASVDYIVAGEVIEHIAPNDLDVVLQEFRRVLKVGGKLLMTTPNPNSFLVKLGRRGVFEDPSHLSIMSMTDQKKLLKRNRFSHVQMFGSGKAITMFPFWFPIFGFFGSYLSISTKE